jgi:hypothetical protein
MRTLFVGKPLPRDVAMLTRMGRRGWGSYSADNLAEARSLIKRGGVDLVLALQNLPDGSAYDLISAVSQSRGSLFVELELSRESVWIPAVDHGERVFGDRGIHPDNLETECEKTLVHCARANRLKTKTKLQPRFPPSPTFGYPLVPTLLGTTLAESIRPTSPTRSRISAIAELQLRCASFGLLRARKGQNEVERVNKAIAPAASGGKTGTLRSVAGMPSHGRRG